MRLLKALVSIALVADAALASSWFNKAGKSIMSSRLAQELAH